MNDSDKGEHRLVGRNARLVSNLAWYSAANLVCILLAMSGTIHPPWNILWFFTLIGPIFIGAILLISFTWKKEDRASNAALGFGIGWIALVAYLNALCLMSAVAAV